MSSEDRKEPAFGEPIGSKDLEAPGTSSSEGPMPTCSPGALTIRRGSRCAEDLCAASGIELACFSDEPWTEEMIAEELANPSCVFLFAEADGSTAGDICAWMLPPYECQIGTVGVLPAFRRRGIAEALMRTMISEAEKAGISDIFLEVRRSNAAAIALYEKLGFELIGVRRRYYENREDALVMKLDLRAPGDDR